MPRDIDYAVLAVKKAITEKFRNDDLGALYITAKDRTILIEESERCAEGTRDDLLAAIRKATGLASLWEVLAAEGLLVR